MIRNKINEYLGEMRCSGGKCGIFYFVAIVLQMVLRNPGIFVTAYKDRLTNNENSNCLTILH